MLKRIRADQVAMGMYVRRFEGSWFTHPFWFARFTVRTDKALRRIAESGVGVVIDAARGADLAPVAAHPPSAPVRLAARPLPPAVLPHAAPAPKPARVAAPLAFGKADKARAQALATRTTEVVKSLFGDAQLGRAVATGPILSVVDDIASTLAQNNRAFLNVTRLRAKDDALYTHSVAVCALMIGLAREMGLPGADVQALGLAGLLHDVGKALLDDAVIGHAGALPESAREAVRRHPALGHALLAAEDGLPAVALDVCLHHHERLDGSGYPHALGAAAISEAARIAMICDAYDALTSTGPGNRALSPAAAIRELEAEGERFDGALLFKFMRSVGVFPAGKLLRLRSNRLGVVLADTAADRRPVVRAFYAPVDAAFIPYADAVLSDRLSDDQALSAEDPARWFAGEWPALAAAVAAGRPLKAAVFGRAARAA